MRVVLLGAILYLASAPAIAAELCPPIAAIDGSPESARELTGALTERGVRVEPSGLPPGECGALRVWITQSDQGFWISIRDQWGRTAERSVTSLPTAAALVESWARMDLLEVVTSTRSTEKPRTPLLPAVEGPKPESIEAPIDERSRVLWRISAELGIGRDHLGWLGGAASLCGRIGIACLGITGRYAISQHRESAVDAMLDLSLPIAIGRLTLTPGIGAGAGWLGGADERCSRHGCREEAERDGFGARVEARLAASLRLFASLHLQLGANLTSSPIRSEDELSFDPHLTILRGHAALLWGAP